MDSARLLGTAMSTVQGEDEMEHGYSSQPGMWSSQSTAPAMRDMGREEDSAYVNEYTSDSSNDYHELAVSRFHYGPRQSGHTSFEGCGPIPTGSTDGFQAGPGSTSALSNAGQTAADRGFLGLIDDGCSSVYQRQQTNYQVAPPPPQPPPPSSSSSSSQPHRGRPSLKPHSGGQTSTKTKQRRKRVVNKQQRLAANHRERKRMDDLNGAFEDLKQRIPTFSKEKRVSRIETLRLAIAYISFMSGLVEGKPANHLGVYI